MANPTLIFPAATQQLVQPIVVSTSDCQSQASVDSQANKTTLTQPVTPLTELSVTVATSLEAQNLTKYHAQLRATSISSASLPATTATSSISTLQQNQTPNLVLNPPTGGLLQQISLNSAIAPNTQKPSLVSSNPETIATLNMLRWSMVFSPENADSDKQSYVPKNPYNYSHSTYPSQPPTQQENIALFEKLPIDTLFFAFYYQPGTIIFIRSKKFQKVIWCINRNTCSVFSSKATEVE